MAMVLSPAAEADVQRIVEVERLAYSTNHLSSVLFPGPFPPEAAGNRQREMIAQLSDPTTRWMKAVDPETGELAAFAKWNIYATPKAPEPPVKRHFGPGSNVEACEEFFGGIKRRRAELMDGKAYVLLDLLQTDPKYQGRGAGGALIQWGLDIADSLHIPAYLESSRIGHRLYEKYGFRDIDELRLNPKWDRPDADKADIFFMTREVK